MANTPRLVAGFALAWSLLGAGTAWGQRVQFGSMAPAESPFRTVQDSGVTLEGTIQPTEPAWDPYADPSAPPPALLPQGDGYYGQPPVGPQPGIGPMVGERFLQQAKFEVTWLAGDKGADFENLDLELSGTFSFPFYYAWAPLLLTPGFAVHFWDGPAVGAGFPPLPSEVYDAYIDFGWRPQITPNFSLDLGVRPGLHSDFENYSREAIRIQGRALGIFSISPQTQIVAGVLYLDRVDVKLLPAGGLIWTPNEDTRYEILFPRPKLAQRISTIGNTDWWAYIAGEFGGGSWEINTFSPPRLLDYNDLRVMVGLEWINFTGLRGYFEAGYVFDRELVLSRPFAGRTKFQPDDTFMLRAGIVY
jgi:hypothetical protein